MNYLKSINEAILPKELRYKNLIYHSTSFISMISILKDNILYSGLEGISTSRGKDYLHNSFDDNIRTGDCQLILDKDLIKANYKINPYDFVEMSRNGHIDNDQMEEQIDTSKIINIKRYIVGIHINNDPSKYINQLKPLLESNWLIFDKNWKLIV